MIDINLETLDAFVFGLRFFRLIFAFSVLKLEKRILLNGFFYTLRNKIKVWGTRSEGILWVIEALPLILCPTECLDFNLLIKYKNRSREYYFLTNMCIFFDQMNIYFFFLR